MDKRRHPQGEEEESVSAGSAMAPQSSYPLHELASTYKSSTTIGGGGGSIKLSNEKISPSSSEATAPASPTAAAASPFTAPAFSTYLSHNPHGIDAILSRRSEQQEALNNKVDYPPSQPALEDGDPTNSLKAACLAQHQTSQNHCSSQYWPAGIQGLLSNTQFWRDRTPGILMEME